MIKDDEKKKKKTGKKTFCTFHAVKLSGNEQRGGAVGEANFHVAVVLEQECEGLQAVPSASDEDRGPVLPPSHFKKITGVEMDWFVNKRVIETNNGEDYKKRKKEHQPSGFL
jgi:hypothetical protein